MQHDFLRFPRNLPIIHLERHIVIGQLFLPNIFLFCASLVSLVFLQQEKQRLWKAKKKGETKQDLHVESSVQFSAAAEGTLQVDAKYLWTRFIKRQTPMLSTNRTFKLGSRSACQSVNSKSIIPNRNSSHS